MSEFFFVTGGVPLPLPLALMEPRPIRLPDGFMAVDREELVTLLRVIVARGEALGIEDRDYREWLESLVEEDGNG